MGLSSSGRLGKELGELGVFEGFILFCCYVRGEEEFEEDSYDSRGKSSYYRSVESNGRLVSIYYYSDSDYRYGVRVEKYSLGFMGFKYFFKSLVLVVVFLKRSKYRK